MSSINAIALSGMQAAQTRLGAAANNVANSDTPGYQRREVQQTAQTQGGVSTQVSAAPDGSAKPGLEADMVAQLQAKNAFLANLAVFKTADAMAGALISHKV